MEVIIGAISGIITASGMGGGTVLILGLTMLLGIPQNIAQAANLIFFIPTSITAIILYIKNKSINIKIGLNLIMFGVVGAIMGAIISNNVYVGKLRKIFGIFLIITAINEIRNFYKQYIKNKNTHNKKKYKIYEK